MVQKLWSTIRENKREEKNIYLLFVFLVFTVFEVSLISRLIQIFSDVEIRFNLLQHKKQSFSQSISLTLVERVDWNGQLFIERNWD